jgi:TonB family protein
MGRMLGVAGVGVLLFGNAPNSIPFDVDNTQYMETSRPRDARFITSIARITACKIQFIQDPRFMTPLYPEESKKHHEQGKVIMQFIIDSDLCVRKATIVQSSGYYRLDKASLGFAMSLKFPTATIKTIHSFDDGQPAFMFPIVWKLVAPVPYVRGDPCSGGARCVDEAPPQPPAESISASPDPGYIWMPGYYVHYANTGYQWNDGHWEPPRPGYHWRAPRWEQAGSKWFFVLGIWEQDSPEK